MKKGKIKVTEKLKKLLCVPLLGLIMATTLAGCSEEEQSTIETVEAGTYDDKIFNEGEHIISVPLEDMNNENYQIDYYDGYEVIGIATSSYGKIAGYYAGGCVLYKNTQKVKCVEDDEGKCTSFGIPVEETKILEK